MRYLAFSIGLVLAGCAARTPYLAPPIVDMTGVDPVRYQADVSECTRQKVEANKTDVITHAVISNCMEAKGYTIFEVKG
jgi:hypothetical protein